MSEKESNSCKVMVRGKNRVNRSDAMIHHKVCELTIDQFHTHLVNGDLTCEALVREYLDRIEKFDKQGPTLNSIIHVNPKAIEEAIAMDQWFKAEGLIGPLHGVPVLLKDNVETMDMPTTAGSLSLEGYMSEKNAVIVDKMKKAGAIIIAKTNLHEFAIWGETISSVLGQTKNPYDLSRTPGGSSGGTGAAIAANFGMVGIGTDTINSIRSPASANNLVGIRPTLGLVNKEGVVPYSYTQDVAGPICRTVEDAAKLLDVLKESGQTLSENLKKDGMKNKNIGVLKSFFGKDKEHVATNNVMTNALEVLHKNGAKLIMLDEDFDASYLVKEVSLHMYDFKDHLNDYLEKLPENAPLHSLGQLIESGKFHAGIKDNLMKASQLSTQTSQYQERLKKREALKAKLLKLMDDHQLDAVLYPHQKQVVCKIGGSQMERNGVLGSVSGFPSICVPAGFTPPSEMAPVGVPVGMELLGRPHSESLLVEIAYGYEQHARVRKPSPLFPEVKA